MLYNLLKIKGYIWRNVAFHHLLTNGSSAVNGCRQSLRRFKYFTGGSVLLWILDSDFGRKQLFNVKNILMVDLFILSSQDVNWWTGVVWITCGLLWCFYQLFGLSFWRHPFTAEHPLLRHWYSFWLHPFTAEHSLLRHWYSFWRHPFTAEHSLLRHWYSFWRHPFTAEHSLLRHWYSFWRHPFTAEHSLLRHWYSFWRHPFTAEHSLLSKWCNATFLQTQWRNKLIYILDGVRVSTFSQI